MLDSLGLCEYSPLMSTKPNPKTPSCHDWHPADVVCSLRKAGWSLRRLSLHHGYKQGSTLKNALVKRWPKAERLIAEAIGVEPCAIWPSRYRDDEPPAPCQRTTARRNHG